MRLEMHLDPFGHMPPTYATLAPLKKAREQHDALLARNAEIAAELHVAREELAQLVAAPDEVYGRANGRVLTLTRDLRAVEEDIVAHAREFNASLDANRAKWSEVVAPKIDEARAEYVASIDALERALTAYEDMLSLGLYVKRYGVGTEAGEPRKGIKAKFAMINTRHSSPEVAVSMVLEELRRFAQPSEPPKPVQSSLRSPVAA